MSISIGGLGGSGSGGGVEWFSIAYFQNYYTANDGFLAYPSNIAGWNNESSGAVVSVGAAWNGVVNVIGTSMLYSAAPLQGGTKIKIKGAFGVTSTLTGDIELHISHAPAASLDWGTSTASVNFTSVSSIALNNPVANRRYEIDQEASFTFAAGDRFLFVFYNKNTGVSVTARVNVSFFGQ